MLFEWSKHVTRFDWKLFKIMERKSWIRLDMIWFEKSYSSLFLFDSNDSTLLSVDLVIPNVVKTIILDYCSKSFGVQRLQNLVAKRTFCWVTDDIPTRFALYRRWWAKCSSRFEKHKLFKMYNVPSWRLFGISLNSSLIWFRTTCVNL